MHLITRETALKIALEEVKRLEILAHDSFEILQEEILDLDEGWLFFYNSADFLKSRNPIDSLAGNGPILISQDGSKFHLPSSVPWEEAIKNVKGLSSAGS